MYLKNIWPDKIAELEFRVSVDEAEALWFAIGISLDELRDWVGDPLLSRFDIHMTRSGLQILEALSERLDTVLRAQEGAR